MSSNRPQLVELRNIQGKGEAYTVPIEEIMVIEPVQLGQTLHEQYKHLYRVQKT